MPRSYYEYSSLSDNSSGEESPDEYDSSSNDSQSSGDEEEYDSDHTKYTRKRHHHFSRTDQARKVHKTQHEGQTKGVYVLHNTRTNMSYVGKSNNIDRRVEQHEQENDGDVLRRESNLTMGSAEDLESWERNEVLARMYRHGMESVRGWRYTRQGPLTADEKVSARNDIMEKFDLCRKCGRNNHFADNCFARTQADWCKHIPM
jgi:predicted GIY-YIG superfamily endonuclease